uniref:Uncharacterized protein n=1 Tax=Musca domestica TaxID=7370 RepID=A0A1I8M570_MUSDO
MAIRQQGFFACLFLIFSIARLEALPSSHVDSRIINGTEVNWNNTRYVVSIRMAFLDNMIYGAGHMCGGSLIAPDIVLTAAHCIWSENQEKFRSPQEFSVVVGSLDRTRKDRNTLQFAVKDIIWGPNFDPDTFEDDIAIMILNQTVPRTYNEYSLIEMNENRNLAAGTKCTVSGWGLTEKNLYATKLRSVEVPIVSRSECSEHYGAENLIDGMLCAGYMNGGRDACSADSGGPLVCNDKLVGIVSFGVGCAMPGYPGIYTDVAYHIDWIRNKTGLKTKEYLQLQNDYFNYTIVPYANNSTGSSNSTHGSNSSTAIFKRSFNFMILILLCIYKTM